ncbi:MAG: exodeoxyribonuclease VII large subunit [Sulfurovaceae bacterium]|nr:exodeoxyribonuclease VII large subunit [Sulfurovaceae bacterium]
MSSSAMMSVSSLNTKIKSLLESTFMHILVEGEVSSATYHTSGHLYFTIKDKESSLKCVMFKSSVSKLKFKVEVGQHIVVNGSISVYAPRGEYQLYALDIEPFGQGALALAYEQLKAKLQEKGYFDPTSKKPIPKTINKIALVTAKDSAALHDMLKIIDKRWPLLDITIIDTLVQGDNAPEQIAKAIRYADKLNVDVVVVARGGGSKEDLWAFNSEIVADALHFAKTPTVSAIGHEIDVMISDFVADLRAPTPSAAMEMILPDRFEILQVLSNYLDDMKRFFENQSTLKTKILSEIYQNLISNSPTNKMKTMTTKYEQTLVDLKNIIQFKISSIESLPIDISSSLKNFTTHKLAQKEQILNNTHEQLLSLDPRKRVVDGWAQVLVKDKLTKLEDISIGQKFILQDKTTKLTVVCENKSKI